jgi:hypothetical protein
MGSSDHKWFIVYIGDDDGGNGESEIEGNRGRGIPITCNLAHWSIRACFTCFLLSAGFGLFLATKQIR